MKITREMADAWKGRLQDGVSWISTDGIREVMSQLIDALVGEPEVPTGQGSITKMQDDDRATYTTERAGIEWHEGYWAWDKDRKRLCQLGQFKDAHKMQYDSSINGRNTADIPATWLCIDGCIHAINEFSIPTRDQLKTKIGTDEKGKPILAWAWEWVQSTGVNELVEYTQTGWKSHILVSRTLVEEADIPIVTTRQVKDMYHGVYPPEERARASTD